MGQLLIGCSRASRSNHSEASRRMLSTSGFRMICLPALGIRLLLRFSSAVRLSNRTPPLRSGISIWTAI